MIDVKLFRKPKDVKTGTTGTGYGGSYQQGSISEAAHAARADYADRAGEADHAKEADVAKIAAQAVDVTPDSPAYDRWLRKDINDTSPGVPTFENGIKAGDWSEGVSGSCLWQDGEGGWHFEADFVNIRKKLTAAEVAIQDVHHVGGQMLLTAASCTADFVQDMGTFYRCYFRRKDDDGKEVRNQWRVGDQAYCRTFNLEKQENGMIGNHYFWRLVTGVSSNNSYDIAFPDFHYVDLSKGTCDYGSDAPRAEDDIVQLGYRGTDNAGRQTAILIAGAAADDSSPFIRLFEGISSFTLPANPEQIKPGDNRLKGVLRIMEGSTLEDGRGINNLGTHRGNMLRNTGFTGDYESVLVDGMTEVEGDTPIYSDPLYQWDYRNTEVWDDPDSASGKSAHVGYLSQVVAGGMTAGAWYVLSFSVRGSCTVTAGTLSKVVGTEAWQRIDWPFIYNGTDDRISFNGEADIREIMLTAGTLPCEWRRAAGDNDKSMSEYFGMEYLRNAISEASTTVLGGLILSQIIKVGNYRDGLMTEETGGMSGARNDGQSPYLWGGGTMEQAIYTIAKYATGPTYQPTRAELNNMAQFVVTHGGRAILNDVILRGYIYALGGLFKGNLDVGSNGDHFILDAITNTFKVVGPDSVEDEPGYPPSPTADTIDLFKIFTETDADTLKRIARMVLGSALGYSITFDAQYGIQIDVPGGGQSLKIYEDTIEASITDTNNIVNKTYMDGSSLRLYRTFPNGYHHLVDSVEKVELHSNGTMVIKKVNSGEVSGTLTVDSNGFLKLT